MGAAKLCDGWPHAGSHIRWTLTKSWSLMFSTHSQYLWSFTPNGKQIPARIRIQAQSRTSRSDFPLQNILKSINLHKNSSCYKNFCLWTVRMWVVLCMYMFNLQKFG
jgi:hypothetical protein